ncbi:MAG: hypothetical protein RLZZ536_2441 [Planctomycetota bacterium]
MSPRPCIAVRPPCLPTCFRKTTRMIKRLKLFAFLLCLLLHSAAFVTADEKSAADPQFTSTHKQVRVIRTLHKDQPIRLHTFCLDRDGNILACVGGEEVQLVIAPDGSQQTRQSTSPRLVQVYSPEGELIREIELSFTPTAINPAPDGSIFVAGDGKVARISSDGRVLATADSPHVGDLEEFRKRVEAGARRQAEEMTAQFREQVTLIEGRLEALRKKPESELTDRERQRIRTYEQQQTIFQTQLKFYEDMQQQQLGAPDAIRRKLGITAVAVTSRDVFLCCNAAEGYGYEVWRLNHEFSEPKRVVSELGGCCGQCDIQATEQHLILAENTKFKVALLDRDGNRLSDFGRGDRKAVDGFGSCCNPMNVRCCSNGDILTAESSIGTIKRFSSSGELLGVIGKARISGGCKHVALGFDEKRNRHYMMHVDKSQICVLVPNSEAPDATPEEQLSKAAREGLGRKLVGEWSLNGTRPKAAGPSASALGAALGLLLGGEAPATEVNIESSYTPALLHFHADGKLSVIGGQSLGTSNSWEAVSQDGNTLLVSQIEDNVQYYYYKVEFISDDEANISMLFDETVMSSNRYRRVQPDAPAGPVAAESAEKPQP